MTETKLLMCLIQAHLVLSHHTVSVPWTRPNQAANVWKILSQFSYTVLGLRAVVIKPERWNILSLNVFETGGVAAEAGAYPSYNRAEAGYVLDQSPPDAGLKCGALVFMCTVVNAPNGFYAIYCKKKCAILLRFVGENITQAQIQYTWYYRVKGCSWLIWLLVATDKWKCIQIIFIWLIWDYKIQLQLEMLKVCCWRLTAIFC